jgi:hypothetical protein
MGNTPSRIVVLGALIVRPCQRMSPLVHEDIQHPPESLASDVDGERRRPTLLGNQVTLAFVV